MDSSCYRRGCIHLLQWLKRWPNKSNQTSIIPLTQFTGCSEINCHSWLHFSTFQAKINPGCSTNLLAQSFPLILKYIYIYTLFSHFYFIFTSHSLYFIHVISLHFHWIVLLWCTTLWHLPFKVLPFIHAVTTEVQTKHVLLNTNHFPDPFHQLLWNKLSVAPRLSHCALRYRLMLPLFPPIPSFYSATLRQCRISWFERWCTSDSSNRAEWYIFIIPQSAPLKHYH